MHEQVGASGSVTAMFGRYQLAESRPTIVCLVKQPRPPPLLSQPSLLLGIRDIFTAGFGFLVEKAVTTRGREFLEFGRRSSAGMTFGPPAAELSPLLSA